MSAGASVEKAGRLAAEVDLRGIQDCVFRVSYRRVTSGGEEIRTPDPLLAKQVLYQLSYAPSLSAESPANPRSANRRLKPDGRWTMWVYQDSNLGPQLYQSCALAN